MNTPTITDEQIAEIEALANAATQGPRHHATDVGQIGSIDVGDRVLAQAQQLEPKDNAHRDRNAAYIASVYPQVLIALISRLRAAERDAARFVFQHTNHEAMLEVEMAALKAAADLDWYRNAIDAAMNQPEPNTSA